MSATETIKAAIDELEADRVATQEWEFNPRFESIDSPSKWIADVLPENGERIMRWHRTIDAQLRILTRSYNLLVMGREVPGTAGVVLGLARAILGDDANA